MVMIDIMMTGLFAVIVITIIVLVCSTDSWWD